MAVINNIPEGFPTYSVGTIAYVDSDGDLHMNVPALQILVSDENDLTGLDVPVGSVAFTADESSKWRLGNDGNWEEVSTSGGGGQGGNGGMVFDLNFVADDRGFVSDDNASTIIDAYKAGTHVVLHFVASAESATYSYPVDGYFPIVGYSPADADNSIDEKIELPYAAQNYGVGLSSCVVDANGKLFCEIYMD